MVVQQSFKQKIIKQNNYKLIKKNFQLSKKKLNLIYKTELLMNNMLKTKLIIYTAVIKMFQIPLKVIF